MNKLETFLDSLQPAVMKQIIRYLVEKEGAHDTHNRAIHVKNMADRFCDFYPEANFREVGE